MSLPTKNRVMVFSVGFFVGCCIVTYVMLNKQQAREDVQEPETVAEMEALVVPKIIQAYEERRVPMESRFIRQEQTIAIDNDTYRRVLILQGEGAGQLVRIEETIQRGHGKFADTVQAWRIMAADRVRVTLAPHNRSVDLARHIKPIGYGVIARGRNVNEFLVSLPDHKLQALPEAIDYLSTLSEVVVSAAPDYLDD